MDRDGLANFFLGLGIGVGLGMLFAPKSGNETRELILNKADQGKEFIKKQTATLQDTANTLVDKGRDVIGATDATLRAEILSYSRSRGLFAGAFLDGSTLRPDEDANARVYKRVISAKQIVLNNEVVSPAAAQQLLSLLNKWSPKNLSS